MYYLLYNLEHTTLLHPGLKKYTDVPGDVVDSLRRWKDLVKMKAICQLNGRFSEEHGHIVNVTRMPADKISSYPVIMPGTGFIKHVVTYDAIVWYPMVGEVVDVEVTKVLKDHFLFSMNHGCDHGTVSLKDFDWVDADYEFKERAEIGDDDVAVLVNCFVCAKSGKVLKVGAAVRVRLIKKSLGHTGFWLTGSIASKFLGVK